MYEQVDLTKIGDVACLRISGPPVNALTPSLIRKLSSAIDAFEAWPGLSALVIWAEGADFSGGCDLSLLDDPSNDQVLFNACLDRLENATRPVIAALHGHVLGSGLALAMACHFRVANDTAQFGLPERQFGLIPGGQVTQRLPRLIGVPRTLDLITRDSVFSASCALNMGLIDRVAEGSALEIGLCFAGDVRRRAPKLRRTRDIAPAAIAASRSALSQARAAANGDTVKLAGIAAVGASLDRTFRDGAAIETKAACDAMALPRFHALRHLFFAERAAVRRPFLRHPKAPSTITNVGIISDGPTGISLAERCADAGLAVILTGTDLDKLDQSELIIDTVSNTQAQAAARARTIAKTCTENAIFATLAEDLSSIASAFGDRVRCVGLQTSGTQQNGGLIELVRTPETNAKTLSNVIGFAQHLGFACILRDHSGEPLINRIAREYRRIGESLTITGATPDQIDTAMKTFGMQAGPFQIADWLNGGAVVANRASQAQERKPTIMLDKMIVEQMLKGIRQTGMRLVDTGEVENLSDLDVIWTSGLGFPRDLGGPMFMSACTTQARRDKDHSDPITSIAQTCGDQFSIPSASVRPT